MGSIYGLFMTSCRTQCRQRLATAAMFLRGCVDRALCHGDATHYTFRRKTASVMKM